MSVLSSKDSFKRIDLDALTLNAAADSHISLDTSITVPIKFVYAGTGGGTQSAISTDTLTWNQNASGFPDTDSRTPVVANDELTIFYTTSVNNDYVSTDGYTWTTAQVPVDVSAATASKPIFANGKFVAIYENTSTPKVRSSTDAVTWTVSSAPGFGQYMAYGNGKYVYYSQPNSTIVTSTDAVTWSESPHTSMPSVFADIMFANNKFIRHSGGYYNYEYSTDAITWTQGTLPPATYDSYTGMAYGNGIYLTVTYDGNVYSSTDLTTWNNTINSIATQATVYFAGGKFYITSSESSTIQSSTDGVTWLQSSKPSYTAFSYVGGGTTGSGVSIDSEGISTTADISARKFIGDGSLLTGLASGGVTLNGTESLSNKTITNSSFKGTLYDNMMMSGAQGMYLAADGTNSFSWVNPPVLSSSGGIVPAEYLVRVNQNRSLTNNAGANNIFDSGNTQITLEPDTLYYVKGIIHAQKPASAGAGIATYSFNFNSVAPQSFIMTNVYFESSSIATNFVTTGQTTQLRKTDGTSSYSMVLVQNATTSAMNAVSMFDGWIKTNQTNTTTLTLQMQHSTSGSSTGITVYPDTYIVIKPYTGISSSATLVSGPWS